MILQDLTPWVSMGSDPMGFHGLSLGWEAKYKMRDVVRMMVEYEMKIVMYRNGPNKRGDGDK